jgi:perosamine synthetase
MGDNAPHMKEYPYTQHTIDPSDIEAVSEALKGAQITRGDHVEAFEMSIAEYCGALHGVAFSNGTAALSAAYDAIDASPYDRLITTPNTYIGTVVGGLRRGTSLHLADIDLSTGGIDLSQLPALLEPAPSRGKSILVPVHYAGLPLNMEKIESLLAEPGAVIIEDACAAFGGTYPSGDRIGCCRHSAMTIFSFHPAKTITTGEGGLILTNDALLAKRLRRVRNNGIENGLAQELTGNGQMTDFQAALGLSQLKRISTILRKRRSLVKSYRKALTKPTLLDESLETYGCPSLMPIRVPADKRDALVQSLSERGIQTRLHYTPLYRHPVITGFNPADFPNMEEHAATTLSLPLYPEMTGPDVKKISEALDELLE